MSEKLEAKMDRRKLRTRRLLRDALIALVSDMSYDDINIQTIADRADVARTTFYLHFRDKDELLVHTIRHLLDGVLHNIPEREWEVIDGKKTVSRDPDSAADFRHIADYADFYRIMLGTQGSAVMMATFRDYMQQLVHAEMTILMQQVNLEPQLPISMISNYIAGAQIGLYVWWLEHGADVSPEEMSRQANLLTRHGVYWALSASVPTATHDD